MEPTVPDAGQYFAREPTVGSRVRNLTLALPDATVELVADRGVFAAEAVDSGTRYLLADGALPPPGPCHLLDLGCGYGPIATTVARRAPEATVWAIDVNERAVALCAENARRLGSGDRLRAVPPDAVPDDVRFAAIWSNPPIRVGKAALHQLLERWLDRLQPGGAAHLVVHKHLGSDSLARWLEIEGWAVVRRGSRMGYRLLDVARP